MLKKLLCAAFALILTAAVCGCTRSAPAPTETEPFSAAAESTEAAQSETQTPTEPAPASGAQNAAPLSESAVLDALDGSWEMLPRGELLRLEPYATLRFDALQRKLTFVRHADSQYFVAHFSLRDLFESSPGSNDLIEVFPDDVSDGFVPDGDVTVLGVRTDFQIMLSVSPDGVDRLALREIGNGNTALAMEGLDYDTTAGDGYWIFERVTDTQKQTQTANLRKGETFYAFRWRDWGATCELQPMQVYSYEEDWYGDMTTVLEFYYTDGADALTAAQYTLSGKAQDAHSGVYDVGMVRVTTDPNGVVTALEDVQGLGYGAYTTG